MTVVMTLTPDDLAFLARASALVPSYAKLAQAKQLIEEARTEMTAALAKLQTEVAPAKPAPKPAGKARPTPLAYGVDLPPPAKAPKPPKPSEALTTVTALLKTHGPMSRGMVSHRTGLSIAVTTVALYALRLQGLASATGRGPNNRWTYHDRTPVLSDLAVRARDTVARGKFSRPRIAGALNLSTRQCEKLLTALRYAGVITECRRGNTSYWKVL